MMKSYKNQTLEPNVGDKIKLVKMGYSVPSSLCSDVQGTLYEVFDVKPLSLQYSVKVKNKYGSFNWIGASQFNLIEPSNLIQSGEKMITENKTWLGIVDGKVVVAEATCNDVKAKAADMIAKNIKIQVVIAEVQTVAKVKKPEIQFV